MDGSTHKCTFSFADFLLKNWIKFAIRFNGDPTNEWGHNQLDRFLLLNKVIFVL